MFCSVSHILIWNNVTIFCRDCMSCVHPLPAESSYTTASRRRQLSSADMCHYSGRGATPWFCLSVRCSATPPAYRTGDHKTKTPGNAQTTVTRHSRFIGSAYWFWCCWVTTPAAVVGLCSMCCRTGGSHSDSFWFRGSQPRSRDMCQYTRWVVRPWFCLHVRRSATLAGAKPTEYRKTKLAAMPGLP